MSYHVEKQFTHERWWTKNNTNNWKFRALSNLNTKKKIVRLGSLVLSNISSDRHSVQMRRCKMEEISCAHSDLF